MDFKIVPLYSSGGTHMKLLFAIVNRDDANAVVRNLSHQGYSSTKLPTSGGFLLASNITLMIGVADEKVDHVISIIREHSHSRTQIIPNNDLSFDFDLTGLPQGFFFIPRIIA